MGDFEELTLTVISRSILRFRIIDDLVKSQISIEFVIPAKAGIQLIQAVLDPGVRRGDVPSVFLRVHQCSKPDLFEFGVLNFGFVSSAVADRYSDFVFFYALFGFRLCRVRRLK